MRGVGDVLNNRLVVREVIRNVIFEAETGLDNANCRNRSDFENGKRSRYFFHE
jgi:hypothetical protein